MLTRWRAYAHLWTHAGNMLVNAGFRVKVADFGTAQVMKLSVRNERSSSMTAASAQNSCVGTLVYMAPEMLSMQP